MDVMLEVFRNVGCVNELLGKKRIKRIKCQGRAFRLVFRNVRQISRL